MSENPGAPLVEKLLRQGDDGERVHTDAEVRHALPYILLDMLGGVDDVNALADETKRLMDDFASALGVTPELGPAKIKERVEKFYADHPVKPSLLNDVKRFIGEEADVGDGAALANGFAKFVGEKTAGPAPVEEPGEGQVRSSPLARFQLNADGGGRKD